MKMVRQMVPYSWQIEDLGSRGVDGVLKVGLLHTQIEALKATNPKWKYDEQLNGAIEQLVEIEEYATDFNTTMRDPRTTYQYAMDKTMQLSKGLAVAAALYYSGGALATVAWPKVGADISAWFATTFAVKSGGGGSAAKFVWSAKDTMITLCTVGSAMLAGAAFGMYKSWDSHVVPGLKKAGAELEKAGEWMTDWSETSKQMSKFGKATAQGFDDLCKASGRAKDRFLLSLNWLKPGKGDKIYSG